MNPKARAPRRYLFALGLLLASVAARTAGAQERDADDVHEWRAGDPAPVGYRVVRKHTWEIVGASVFGAGYLLSVTLAIAPVITCGVSADGPGDPNKNCSPIVGKATPWLYLPIAGPFVALSYPSARQDGGAVFWLATFGALQAAGAAAWIYGAAVPHYRLKRWASITVAPLIAHGAAGAFVLGRF